jgi:hypothetical protein
MSPLAQFLQDLLQDGRIHFANRPARVHPPPADAIEVLERAYATHSLTVAGPLILFDPVMALAAAEMVMYASWFVVSHDEPDSAITEELRMPHLPATAADHLNADLFFRYLPQVHRRSRAMNPEDPLTVLLEKTMCDWPLSGVLGDVAEPPSGDTGFGGHAGLQLLYAERLAMHEKPAWTAPGGSTSAFVELVWHNLGKETPSLPESPSSLAP